MDRLKFLQILFFLVAATILARLFYWQFLAGIEKREIFDAGQNSIPAPRGDILSSDSFPLATNTQAYLLYANPKLINSDPEKLATSLASSLISEKFATVSALSDSALVKEKEDEIKKIKDTLNDRLSSKNLFWVLLKRKIPANVKDAIEALNITGLGFERDDKRLYPESSMAAHLLGFVGSDKFGNDTGYFGLEGFYNRALKGTPGKRASTLDALGFPILTGKFRDSSPQKGATIKTTIDRTVQFIVERSLKEAVEKYGAKDGTVIVADPKTGYIVAMATYPNYDPTLYQEYDPTLYKNPAVADSYEPGSTFKVVTLSSALDLNLVTPQTQCDVCSGPRKIGGYEISTWNKKYYPNSTIVDIITHSDNVGMTFIAEKLGIERFYKYIIKFGFGKLTGVDLEEETPGFVRNIENWREIDLATASFGQGLAATPIQIIQAVSTIANGGTLIPPRIVESIIAGGKQQLAPKPQSIQVIEKKAATQITEMMVAAVENGEARAFKPKQYRIAGKTGTAQIPVEGHYDPEKTIASFVGFAPPEDPKFVMLVRFTEPSASIFGSETAAPTFFKIAQDLFNYFGIAPGK